MKIVDRYNKEGNLMGVHDDGITYKMENERGEMRTHFLPKRRYHDYKFRMYDPRDQREVEDNTIKVRIPSMITRCHRFRARIEFTLHRLGISVVASRRRWIKSCISIVLDAEERVQSLVYISKFYGLIHYVPP